MSSHTFDGRDLRQVISFFLRRNVTDSELAEVLDMPASTYSKRKESDGDFPGFRDLGRVAVAFGIEPTILYVDFGFFDPASLSEELRQRHKIYRAASRALGVVFADNELPEDALAELHSSMSASSVDPRVKMFSEAIADGDRVLVIEDGRYLMLPTKEAVLHHHGATLLVVDPESHEITEIAVSESLSDPRPVITFTEPSEPDEPGIQPDPSP